MGYKLMAALRKSVPEAMVWRLKASKEFMSMARRFYREVNYSRFVRSNTTACIKGDVNYNAENRRDTYLSEGLPDFIGYLPAGRREVTEIGCGLGNSLKLLEGKKFRTIGIDLSAPMLFYAKNTNKVKAKLYTLDLRNKPLPKSGQAGILAGDVFGYFAPHEHAALMHKIYEGLSPDGIVFIRWAMGYKKGAKGVRIIETEKAGKRLKRYFFALNSMEYLKALVIAAGFTRIEHNDAQPSTPDGGRQYALIFAKKGEQVIAGPVP